LSRIDVAAFEAALTRWITDLLGEESPSSELKPTAVDGKALRGTWQRFEGAVKLLAVIDTQTKCVLHQRRVASDTNEHQTALDVLKELVLGGGVITADAAFCDQDVCETIIDSGGHYVLPVKDNQPTLLNAISLEFTASDAVLPFENKDRPPTPSVNARPSVSGSRPSGKNMRARNAGRWRARPH